MSRIEKGVTGFAVLSAAFLATSAMLAFSAWAQSPPLAATLVPPVVDSIVAVVLDLIVRFATGTQFGSWMVTATALLIALHPFASAITRFTDTPKDDAAIAWIYRNVIERLAMVTGKAKQLPGGVDPTVLVKRVAELEALD